MSNLILSEARIAPALLRPGPVGAWLRCRARRAVDGWMRRRRERRAAAELGALDDIMLRDIGLSRYDVLHAARYGRPERGGDGPEPLLPRRAGSAKGAAVLSLLAALALSACAGQPGPVAGTPSGCEAMGLRSLGGRAPLPMPRCDAARPRQVFAMHGG